MSNPNALCIKCGEWKLGTEAPCAQCLFVPTTALDHAQSYILSTHPDHGRRLRVLEGIGRDLRSGRPYAYDPHDLDAALQDLSALPTITTRTLTRDTLLWLGPLLLAIAALWFLLRLSNWH